MQQHILHVVDYLDPKFGGGTAERTFQMAKAVVRLGSTCTVLCTNLGLNDTRVTEMDGVEVLAVPARRVS